MGKLSPNVTAALILGACIIIAAWIHKPIARYNYDSQKGVTFDTKTGDMWRESGGGGRYEIKTGFRKYTQPN